MTRHHSKIEESTTTTDGLAELVAVVRPAEPLQAVLQRGGDP
jgi:hypothetical protein